MRGLAAFALGAFTFIALAAPDRARADTMVSGGNLTTQTWTLAGSPYVITGDVTVVAGQTLTIQAGVTVRFASGDDQGAGQDVSRSELRVLGTLVTQGTTPSPVKLLGASIASGLWAGVSVQGAGSLLLSNTWIWSATRALVTNTTGEVLVDGLDIRLCDNGIAVQAGTPAFDHLRIQDGATAILVTGGSPTIQGSQFLYNAMYALRVEPSAPGMTVNLIGSTAVRSGTAVSVDASVATTVNVQDCVIAAAYYYGVERIGSAGQVNVTYSDLWFNANGNSGVTTGEGCISANPLFVSMDSPNDLHLTSNSPARFGGSAGQDMGALPYVGDPTDGLHGTLWSDVTLSAGEHAVAGDLTIAPGVTLTTGPGAHLVISGGDMMRAGDVWYRTELIVHGTWVSTATAEDPVTLNLDMYGTEWVGIVVAPDAQSSNFEHLAITGAQRAFDVRATDHGSTLHDVSIGSSVRGVVVRAGELTVDGLTVTGAQEAIRIEAGDLQLRNAVITQSTGSAVRALSSSGLSTVVVGSSTLHGNADGVAASVSPGAQLDLIVANSIITGCSGTAVVVDGTGTANVSVDHSNLWGNATDFSNASAGTGCIASDPQYAAPPSDLSLSTGSPCIDSASATLSPAIDRVGASRPFDGDGLGGAQFDMGAYERGATMGMGVDAGTDAGTDAATTADGGHVADAGADAAPTALDAGVDAAVDGAVEVVDAALDSGSDAEPPLLIDSGMNDAAVVDGAVEPDSGPMPPSDASADDAAVDGGTHPRPRHHCGCQTLGARDPDGRPWLWAGLVLAGLAWRRRRRFA